MILYTVMKTFMMIIMVMMAMMIMVTMARLTIRITIEDERVFFFFQVDVFASDSIVEGERREAIWYHGKHVYECVMKVW